MHFVLCSFHEQAEYTDPQLNIKYTKREFVREASSGSLCCRLTVQLLGSMQRERGRERQGRQWAFILSTSTALIRSLITQGNGMPGEKRGRDRRGKERRDGAEVGRVHASEWQCSKIDPRSATPQRGLEGL